MRVSIWDATEATPSTAASSTCRTFVGEGTGYTCTLDPFKLQKGVTYKLKFDGLDTSSLGTLWQATITNSVSGEITEIGRIRARNGADQHSARPSVNFTEYYGPSAVDKYSVPQPIVRWTAPEMDGTKQVFSSFIGQEGTEYKGNLVPQSDGSTLYELINGSISICE